MLKTAVAALALLSLFQSLSGQTLDHHSHETFDRELAIDHALSFNKDLHAARYLVARAEARLAASGILDNPSAQVDYADDFAFNNEGEGSLGLSITQSFPLARRLAKEKAVSRADIARAKMEVRRHELELIETICEFALDIHLIDERAKTLESLEAALRQSSDFVDLKVQTGELSPFDARQITLDLRVLEQQILNLELERERLVHRLAPHLGQPSSEHFFFESDRQLPYADGELPGYDPEVLERNPDFQMAVLDEQSAEAEIALARSRNWEEVTTKLFWKNEKGIDGPIGRTSDHVLGVSVSIPLPLRKKGDLLALEKQAVRDQSRLTAAAIRFRIENDIEHARHEATLSKRRMDSYRAEVLQLAETQLEETRRAYENGQLDMLTLLRAQEQRVRLEEAYLDLYGQYAHALLELELARLDVPALKINQAANSTRRSE